MKHKTFDHLFFKYLISYLLILLIPILSINVLFSHRFIKAYKKEIQAQADADLVYLGQMIDAEMQTIATTADQMRMSMNFDRYHFVQNPLQSYDYINQMAVYSTTNPLLNEIGIYLRGEEYMFINQSTCPVDLFLNNMYQFEKTSPEEMRNLLIHEDRRIVLPEQIISIPGKKDSFLTILEPLYTDYETVRGMCLFFIRASDLEHFVNSRLDKYEAYFSIEDMDGALLFSANTMPEESYVFSQYCSPQTGYIYTAYIPESLRFVEKISSINRELFLTTLLVFLVSGIVISILMRMNYSPIRKLKEKASLLGNFHSKSSQENSLETISTTLDYLSNQNLYLTDKLKNSAAAIKSGRIYHLLTGHYRSREDFNMDTEDLNMGYINNHFFVAMVQVHGYVEDYDSLALCIQKFLSQTMECFYTFTPEPDKIIFIQGIEENFLIEDQVESVLRKLRIEIRQKFSLDITIGVGNSYSGTLSIPRSYLEAKSALDYRFVKGNGTVILYQTLQQQEHNTVSFPKHALDQLRNALDRRDRHKIHEWVCILADNMENKNLPLFAAKGICFDIISIFMETATPLQTLLPNGIDTSDLMNMETVDDVIGLIQRLDWNVAEIPKDTEKENSDILLDNLKQYIRDNCLRCEFSIQETAEHFHMLLPNLSQFFKEKNGGNILDYSTQIRMQKAKELLANSELTLKDISQQVGYYNVSSFIRRFKQIEGMTPGDYRKYLTGSSHFE